jgi:hypothetical protein
MAEEEELGLVAHRFSNEAFEVAKAFVAGNDDPEELKVKATELRERLPTISSRLSSLPDAERADANRVLSEANLDIGYVLAGGNVPSSIRLHHVMSGH